jgi:ribonuclease HI
VQKKNKISIFCDGGARGNPGPAASAFVVYDGGGELIFKYKKFLGVATNNVAEYQAVVSAHEWLQKNSGNLDQVTFTLDSELITNQLSGSYKIKSQHLLPFVQKIKKIQSDLSHVTIKVVHTNRSGNEIADALVNEALDENIS